MNLADWHAGGKKIKVGDRALFVRVEGDGPWITLLHGFPSSSWDWSKVAPKLAGFRLLMPDFLGFGASDKPRGHIFSIAEQANLVEGLWKHFGVTETGLVSHDYGNSVAAELLARIPEGKSTTRITKAVVLNGSIYGDLNRLLFVQKLLRTPYLGAVITQFISEGLFQKNFQSVFSEKGRQTPGEYHEHWEAIHLQNGNRLYHRLVHHYGEEDRFGARWKPALESSSVPRHFVWGMDDPVSTGAMLARIRERGRGVTIRELPGVKHYPHLEVPDEVAKQILATFSP